jgi:hopanoid biosynthesis associated protein HpnK
VRTAVTRSNPQRRLVVNADDFGRSASINEAVVEAHTRGILTTASLMVAEPCCGAAVRLAHEQAALGVGLHLSLLLGRAALPAATIPGLVNGRGEFRSGPFASGLRFFFNRSLREQLRAELHEQFSRFRDTGLPLDHVNGHLHMHLHPVVLDLLMQDAALLGIERMRLTNDPLRLSLVLSSGNNAYRFSHAMIYRVLSARARKAFRRGNIRFTPQVFGLLQNARVDERYLLNLLPRLPAGDSELYSHPSLDEFQPEFDALVSPAVKQTVDQLGLQLIRYQDL